MFLLMMYDGKDVYLSARSTVSVFAAYIYSILCRFVFGCYAAKNPTPPKKFFQKIGVICLSNVEIYAILICVTDLRSVRVPTCKPKWWNGRRAGLKIRW